MLVNKEVNVLKIFFKKTLNVKRTLMQRPEIITSNSKFTIIVLMQKRRDKVPKKI